MTPLALGVMVDMSGSMYLAIDWPLLPQHTPLLPLTLGDLGFSHISQFICCSIKKV